MYAYFNERTMFVEDIEYIIKVKVGYFFQYNGI